MRWTACRRARRARFLIVGLDTFRQIQMRHEAHIGLVDAMPNATVATITNRPH